MDTLSSNSTSATATSRRASRIELTWYELQVHLFLPNLRVDVCLRKKGTAGGDRLCFNRAYPQDLMTDPTPADRYRARIVQAFEMLEAADGERKTLAELASAVKMSPFHFHRVFRALTGETVGAASKRFRLARGLRLLCETDRPITDVGLEVGYNTPQNFARAFKAVTGSTPSEARNDIELASRIRNLLTRPRFVAMKNVSNFDIAVVELPPIRTIGIRHVGPPAGIGAVFQRLMAWVAQSNLLPAVQAICTVYENDAREVPPAEFRAIACAALAEPIEPGDGMEVFVLGDGPHARLVHEGPYQGLGEGYDALYGRWLPTSGRDLADRPPFEKYLNDPRVTQPDDLRTEIYLPLQRG